MKQPFLYKIVCILISICLLLPGIYLVSHNTVGSGEGSDYYLYVYREGESWDHSYDNYSGLNWENVDDGFIAQGASDGTYADVQSVLGSGDYAEWDFNVHRSGTYNIWVRGYHSIIYNICSSIILEWNGSQINDDPQDWGETGGWTWSCFGNVTCAADTLATIRIKSLSGGWVPVDKLLITNRLSYTPSGVGDGVGSITHDIGKRLPSWGDGIFDLNYDFIYNKTYSLSQVINTVDWPTNLEKGRAFGTPGEQDAADKLEYWLKQEIGIHTARERVIAYPGDGIDDKMEITGLGLTINNGTEQKIDEVFMGINSSRNKFIKLDETDTGNYTCANLAVRNWYDAHKSEEGFGFAETFDMNFSDFLNNYAEDIINETMNLVNTTNATFQGTLFNVTLEYFEDYHNISFSNPDENNSDNWLAALPGYNRSTVEPYVWIIEDPWNNPNPNIEFPNYVDSIYKIINNGKNYIIENYFFKFSILTYIIRVLTEFGLDKCKGIILYDFNNNTHNMINTQTLVFPSDENYDPDNIKPMMGLPLIFINGSIGQKINESYEDYNVSFYRNQSFDDSVDSYNVIGTIYGVEQNKTVILSSLYDSWWNQGTADSAIGISTVLGIAKYFKENKIVPRYNLKFVCFSGEEYGYLGACSYEARHKDEEIVAVIDLNQLGFEERYDIPLNFTVYVNNEEVSESIGPILQQSNYENLTFHNANFSIFVSADGAPSNDNAFATKRNESGIQTICFLKDTGWTLHHRDGKNGSNEPHSDGDVLSYYNKTYVEVASEMVLNVTKYIVGGSIFLLNGWNLITDPYDDNDWNASDLAENITGCQSVSRWDAVSQTYQTYIVGGPPTFDFSIDDGIGYFVHVNQTSFLPWSSSLITNVSINYDNITGWHLIGWYKDSPIMASDLADEIDNSSSLNESQYVASISKWNAINQTYKTYIVGGPSSFDFVITKGMGLFVDIENVGTNSGNGSGNAGLPHTIWGFANYKDDAGIHANNANVTILNENTSERIYTIVGLNASGWYREELFNLPSGWSDGDIINISICSTDTAIYAGWIDNRIIIANVSVGNQKVQDMHLSSDSNVIRYDNGTEEDEVVLDDVMDEVLKTFYVDGKDLEKADSAKLWIYARADGSYLMNDSHKIKVNNCSNFTIYFNPMDNFGKDNSWQSFNISLDWLLEEYNYFSVIDAYSDVGENDLIVYIDLENDNNMSQWKEDTKDPLPPASECEGELMMVLQLFY